MTADEGTLARARAGRLFVSGAGRMRVGEELLEVAAGQVEVVEAMADGALERFDADVACGVTGIAGPDGGSDEKPPLSGEEPPL